MSIGMMPGIDGRPIIPPVCSSMDQPSWENVANKFAFDGSWRDLYIFDTDVDVWQQMLNGLRSAGCDLVFRRDGQACDLPQFVSDVFAATAKASQLLWVRFTGVVAACHFFTPDEIEFDIDPREVKGREQFDGVLSFMRLLSSSTRRDVVMTPENVKDVVILRARFDGASVEYTPFGGWS